MRILKHLCVVAVGLLVISCNNAVKSRMLQSPPNDSTENGSGGLTEVSSQVAVSQCDVRTADTLGLRLPISFTMEVKAGDKTIQTIRYAYDWSDILPNGNVDWELTRKDVNFDEYDDILIYLGSYGNQGIEYYDCYVWNGETNRFVNVPEYREICNPKISCSDSLIYGKARCSAAEYEYTKYMFCGKRLEKKASLDVKYSANRNAEYTETTFDNGTERKRRCGYESLPQNWKDIIN